MFEYLGKNKPPFMNRNTIVCRWRFDSFQSDIQPRPGPLKSVYNLIRTQFYFFASSSSRLRLILFLLNDVMIELDLNFKKPHILRLPVRWVSKNIFLGFDHKYGPFMEYRLHLRLLLLLLRCLNTFFVNKTKSFNISLDKDRRDLWR